MPHYLLSLLAAAIVGPLMLVGLLMVLGSWGLPVATVLVLAYVLAPIRPGR